MAIYIYIYTPLVYIHHMNPSNFGIGIFWNSLRQTLPRAANHGQGDWHVDGEATSRGGDGKIQKPGF